MEGKVIGASASVNAHAATSSSSERLAFHPEKKFNVVIYGISECPNGTSRSERLNQDLSDVVSVLSKVSSSIEPQAIKDCFRLGKFNPQRSKPRPILVKFIRIADVHCILSNKRLLSSPIFIKPDMTAEERHRESVLLKEKWKLIQSGIPKNVIKIQGSRLYVRKKLYGQFENSTFVLSSASQSSSVSYPSPSTVRQSVSHTSTPSTSDTPSTMSDNLPHSKDQSMSLATPSTAPTITQSQHQENITPPLESSPQDSRVEGVRCLQDQ